MRKKKPDGRFFLKCNAKDPKQMKDFYVDRFVSLQLVGVMYVRYTSRYTLVSLVRTRVVYAVASLKECVYLTYYCNTYVHRFVLILRKKDLNIKSLKDCILNFNYHSILHHKIAMAHQRFQFLML